MMETRIYQMLGLCQKARLLAAGEFAAKEAVLGKKAYFVIVAEDASKNTKKLFRDKAGYRNIPCVEWGTKEKLGSILGKEPRAVVAILDEKLSIKIKEMIG